MDDLANDMQDPKERLARDLRVVVDDAEQLMRHAVKDAGKSYEEARSKLQQSLQAAKANLVKAEEAIALRAKQAATATDDYVRQHPWESIGIGAGIGFLIGLLLTRR